MSERRPYNEAVMNMLGGLLSADKAVRTSAEQYLHQLETQEGFGPEISHVVLGKDLPPFVRQLACIILKNYVKTHWSALSDSFVSPETTLSDKTAIKASITQCLSCDDSKLRTAVSMAISAILHWEWPKEWPTAFSDLIRCLRSADQNLLRGSLRCLDLFIGSDNLLESNIPDLTSSLFPELLRIFVSPFQYDCWIRLKAVGIFYSCIQWLSIHESLGKKKLSEIFGANLPSWMAAFAASLASSQQQQQRANTTLRGKNVDSNFEIGIKTVVVQTLATLLASFPAFMKQYIVQLVPHLWECFVNLIPDYERGIIFSSELEGEPDEEGELVSITKLVSSLLECFNILLEKSSFRASIASHIEELIQATISLMQMTSEQSEKWSHDCDIFVQEEDDESFSRQNLRLSGKDLLSLICESFSDGTKMCWIGIDQRLSQAASMREAQHPHWWRLREAALMAVSAVSQKLVELTKTNQIQIDLSRVLASLLAMDVAFISQKQDETPSNSYSGFLIGRALCCAADLSKGVTPADSMPFIHAATMTLVQRKDFITTIGACKALVSFCPNIPSPLLAPFMPSVLTGISTLLATAAEDTLILLLTTLQVAVKVSPEAATIYESNITTALLSVWARKPNDALLADDVAEVLKRLSQIPQCLPGIQERVLPTIALVFSTPNSYPGLISSCIDMLQFLAILSQNNDSISTSFKNPVVSLLKFLLSCSDDDDSINFGCSCLRLIVFKFGPTILQQWNGGLIKGFFDVVLRLLDPSFEDFRASDAAQLESIMISKLYNPQLLPLFESLFKSTLRRLLLLKEASTVMVFVNVFIMIAVQNPGWLVGFLVNAGENVLQTFMSLWISHHQELHKYGHFQVKQSVVALNKILLLRSRNIEETIVTIGTENDNDENNDGTTSSKKTNNIPLPVAILQIICQEYKRSDWETSMNGTSQQKHHYKQQQQQQQQSIAQQPSKKQHGTPVVNADYGGYEEDEDGDGEEQQEEEQIDEKEIEKLRNQGSLFAPADDYGSFFTQDGDEYESEEEEIDEEENEAEDKDIFFVQESPLFRLDLKHHLESAVREAVSSNQSQLDFLKSLYFRMSQNERAIFDILWSRVKKPTH